MELVTSTGGGFFFGEVTENFLSVVKSPDPELAPLRESDGEFVADPC